jgi:hypothetical protein
MFIPDPGVKKATDSGSGCAPLVNSIFEDLCLPIRGLEYRVPVNKNAGKNCKKV